MGSSRHRRHSPEQIISPSAAVDVGATSLERCAGSPRTRFRTAAGAWVPRTNAQRTKRSRRTRPHRPPVASDRAPPPVPGSPRRRRDTSGFGRSGTGLRRRASPSARPVRACQPPQRQNVRMRREGRPLPQPARPTRRPVPTPARRLSSSRSGARARGRRLRPAPAPETTRCRPLREHFSLTHSASPHECGGSSARRRDVRRARRPPSDGTALAAQLARGRSPSKQSRWSANRGGSSARAPGMFVPRAGPWDTLRGLGLPRSARGVPHTSWRRN